jgi:cell division septation protein DedD
MTNKSAPPDKPYIYAFSSARLVLLVCMVLALMAFSLMLGIRIERYQRTNKVIEYERQRRLSAQPPPEEVTTLPETESGFVQPVPSAPEPPEGSEAKSTAPPKPKAPVSEPKIKPKKPAPPPEIKKPAEGHYAVQVASSQDKIMADSMVKILKGKGFETYIEEIDLKAKGRFFRVMVGPFQTKVKAAEVRGKLIKDSRFSDSYIRYLP